MALTDGESNNMVMPVAPMYGGGNGGFGNGFGGDWAWIILLLLLGWGNNGWGNNGFGGNGNGDFPWLMTGQQNINTNTNNGFRDAMINDGITSIRDGISGLSTQLCNCCGDMQMALANGFSGVEQGANARQMANMQSMFGIQSALQECCCENRAGIADLKYTVATENCADRTQSLMNTRDIIDSQTRGTQAILDKLCQLELDGVKAQVEAKNDRIAELQTQLNMANLSASQTAQNAFIAQGFANEVDQLYNRLNSCPVPTTPVYGRTPIFTCNNNGCGCGTGCGCGSF
jgi:hypothetical protein